MADLSSLAETISLLLKTAPAWLGILRDPFLNAVMDNAAVPVARQVRKWTGFDEKRQLHRMELALQNAAERGLGTFQSASERDQYRHILALLSEPGPHFEALCREAFRLFTISENPNLEKLEEAYNSSLLIRTLTQPEAPSHVNARPYLTRFFETLIEELYIDPVFRDRMREVLNVRAMHSMQRSLVEVMTALHQIGDTLVEHYSFEQLERDVATYLAHMERAYHYLKLAGFVPKGQYSEHTDPELNAIFIPLHFASGNLVFNSIDTLLTNYPFLVLIGGPGSGKSTLTRYLALNSTTQPTMLTSVTTLPQFDFLPEKPLPLRIELRRFSEDRRQRPEYNFLSYVAEVQLGRAGRGIDMRMFQILLERRAMLLLFDGLDEVATLDERRILIEEIEEFARTYPGNRIVVTTRPVGYELARFSDRWFVHASIQEFNDQQIRLFLERWYMHVLRLVPLLPNDQEELEALYTTLINNTRLRTLASNPLLLTVITTLHRYERLPDRRVKLYDRCADLLLDTWAKLRGTNDRWRAMRMQKEDQYACVAHLGFILHNRSEGRGSDATASDVPTKFIMREIETFLQQQQLFASVAERRAEASLFLDLVKVEAGLIVERGVGEDNEALYGFVHRTFQEYFAAVHIYENSLQEENSTAIGTFLLEHLHDPHWQEVILLLLGKLKRKPVTTLLRQILTGKSHRSCYTDIVQHDLFFICECLIQEIAADIEFVKHIVISLHDLVKGSPFPSQQAEAQTALDTLLRTQQYGRVVQEELRRLSAQERTEDETNQIQDISGRNVASVEKNTAFSSSAAQRLLSARALFMSSTPGSNERHFSTQMLVELAQQPDLPFELNRDAAQVLYDYSLYASEQQRLALQLLLRIAQLPNSSLEQALQITKSICESCPSELADDRRQTAKLLLGLEQRFPVSLEHALQITETFTLYCSFMPKEHYQATQMLMRVAQRTDLTFEKAVYVSLTLTQALIICRPDTHEEQHLACRSLWQFAARTKKVFEHVVLAAQRLHDHNCYDREEQRLAVQILLSLAQQLDLPVELALLVISTLSTCNLYGGEEQQWAVEVILSVAQRADLSIQQAISMARLLYKISPVESLGRQKMIQILLDFLQKTSTSVEEAVTIAQLLCLHSTLAPDDCREVVSILLQWVQRSDLSFEETVQITSALYEILTVQNSGEDEVWMLTNSIFHQLASQSDLSIERTVFLAQALHDCNCLHHEVLSTIVLTILRLARQPNLSLENTILVAQALCDCNCSYSQIRQLIVDSLLDLAQQPISTAEQAVLITRVIPCWCEMGGKNSDIIIQMFLRLLQQPTTLSLDKILWVVESFLQWSALNAEKQRPFIQESLDLGRQYSTHLLLSVTKWPSVSFEQFVQIAQILYRLAHPELAGQLLLTLIQQRSDVSFEQVVWVIQVLSHNSDILLARKLLRVLIQWPTIEFEQVIQVAQIFYSDRRSADKESANQLLLGWIQRTDASSDQVMQLILLLYQNMQISQFTEVFLNVIKRPDIASDKVIKVALLLYNDHPTGSSERNLAGELLLSWVKKPDLPGQQVVQLAVLLYKALFAVHQRDNANALLSQLVQKENLTKDERLQIAALPFSLEETTYVERVQALELVHSLDKGEYARYFVEKSWKWPHHDALLDASTIPSLVELVTQNVLPTEVRDKIYRLLCEMIPLFGAIK